MFTGKFLEIEVKLATQKQLRRNYTVLLTFATENVQIHKIKTYFNKRIYIICTTGRKVKYL